MTRSNKDSKHSVKNVTRQSPIETLLSMREETLPTAATARKTTKMPHAPMLNDGKAVRFETWDVEKIMDAMMHSQKL
ncbi:hypothetical protein N7472_005886 [Penicillium cf. griseofulvum]|uniref:Uncharacterized protein n=1 Tax=Penicillium cf. griseofulvum TaxID=2972120 RepID=A0A9W9MG56_9EURO|nr:hypothetical protein N7472_005886 [Penicillium cf. griseofulvum]